MKGRMEDAVWMKTTHGCCGLFFGEKNEGRIVDESKAKIYLM